MQYSYVMYESFLLKLNSNVKNISIAQIHIESHNEDIKWKLELNRETAFLFNEVDVLKIFYQ